MAGRRLTWNTAFRPLFYRDIWPILYRPDQFRFLCDILAQSNFPHDQEQRGLFNPDNLSMVPKVRKGRRTVAAKREAETRAPQVEFVSVARLAPKTAPNEDDNTWIDDRYGPVRRFLFGLLRLAGEENEFKVADKISSREHNLPLMPLLCGDNPLTNKVPAKFLRLTDYQLFILKQWADGLFINEIEEGWLTIPPYNPFLPYPTTPPTTGRQLDQGVLSNVLGGAFCPGAEACWIMRNPAIYWEPYRFKADRSVANFLETAAQVNQTANIEADYTFNVQDSLNLDSDFDIGLQPGDITKYSAVPWQADFNECTTNPTDVTYADWNVTYPDSENDTLMRESTKVWVTLWWPAHRPLQYGKLTGFQNGDPQYLWTNWSKGIPQTNQGDLKMVTEWSNLGFIIRNPLLPASTFQQAASGPPPYLYVSVETPQR